VPFCAHHCGYCDFAVAAGQDHLADTYLDALAAELSTLGTPQLVQTLFIGGGTPSHLTCRQLQRLLRDVQRWLPLEPGGEFTLEANPDDLTDPERVAVLAEGGVTRLSLGVQSFQPPLLQVLERRHNPADVPRVVALIRRWIPQLSLDLIFGIPGQSLAEWDADLHRALDLSPDHLSTYGLTFEKGTRLWKQWRQGRLRPLDEATELALYTHAIDLLERAGWEHYEISNFARPGMQSRHNQVYWANHAYFGFGVGAARYIQGRRELNTRDLHQYVRKTLAGEPATFQSEELGPEERARETIAVQLRRACGIDRRAFREQTGFELDVLVGPALARHEALGLIQDDGAGVRLTRQGKCVADALVRDLI
jgi:oxygen-independent coproporphyrinogen-3 oxidase